jgi:oligoendopeptidase F
MTAGPEGVATVCPRLRLGAQLAMIMLAAIPAGIVAAASAPPRIAVADEAERYVWNLSPLYASDAAWEAERASVVRDLATVGDLRETLGRTSASLLAALNRIADLRRRSANLLEYAILVSNLDMNSAHAQAQFTAARSLSAQVESAVSFADYELIALGSAQLDVFYREQPTLEVHRPRIHRTLHDAPHLLRPDAEAVARSAAAWPLVASNAYEAFVSSPLPWPQVATSTGTRTVTVESFAVLRTAADPAVRHAAILGLLAYLRPFEPPFASLLNERIQADLTLARARHFPDAIAALLHGEGMPSGVVDALVAVARDNRELLQRYQRLRARAVAASTDYSDSWVAPRASTRVYGVRETLDTIVAMSAPGSGVPGDATS